MSTAPPDDDRDAPLQGDSNYRVPPLERRKLTKHQRQIIDAMLALETSEPGAAMVISTGYRHTLVGERYVATSTITLFKLGQHGLIDWANPDTTARYRGGYRLTAKGRALARATTPRK